MPDLEVSAEDYYWDHSVDEVLESAGLTEDASLSDIDTAVEEEASFASLGGVEIDQEELRDFLIRTVEAAETSLI